MELGINSAHAQHEFQVLLKSFHIYHAPSTTGTVGDPSRACHGSKQKSFEDCPSETLTRPLVYWEHQTFLQRLNGTQSAVKRKKLMIIYENIVLTQMCSNPGGQYKTIMRN